MKKKKIILCLLGAALAAFAGWVLWANTAPELNTVTVAEANLPQSFDGFRIAHVSDLHSAELGQGNGKLLALLRQARPDIIAITGDMMDCRDTDPAVALEFAAEAARIAPCYYITGNHETLLEPALYGQLLDGLDSAGVTVLEDEEVVLTRQEDQISLVGHFWGPTENVGELSDFGGYRILLSHQPEDLDNYAAAGYDLVLSGHAHGGQFRLPFIGGLYAPGQGIFPKYDSGLYSQGDTDLIVSRGIGNSTFPLRFNNRPEIILVVLKREVS